MGAVPKCTAPNLENIIAKHHSNDPSVRADASFRTRLQLDVIIARCTGRHFFQQLSGSTKASDTCVSHCPFLNLQRSSFYSSLPYFMCFRNLTIHIYRSKFGQVNTGTPEQPVDFAGRHDLINISPHITLSFCLFGRARGQ